jgi:hypothetical protein
MDRTLKVFKPSGHLLVEVSFNYDHPKQCKAHHQEYRQLYDDNDPDDESKSVYPSMDMEHYVTYREFKSIAEIKAYDKDFVKNEIGRYLSGVDLNKCRFEYDASPVLYRYILANHQGFMAMINVMFSFIDNTKEIKLLSGYHPRFDMDVSTNSLETNVGAIVKIPLYVDRDEREISSHDLRRLPAWY